ncbi:MAG: UDP-N-acetylmuramoyl-L-alanine--D-glutamate ligase [Desulfofustis sp.]|nr:UDP-N-acetylmuramoyl-L-alanine--D-glutamate ligase [Desulfofustis sp.]
MRLDKTSVQTVAVVGFGRAGQAMVRYLHGHGVRVLVSDMRTSSNFGAEERHLLDRCVAGFEGGGHSSGFLGQAETVVVSPGVDHHHPVFEELRQSGIAIVGELALAAGSFTSPVVAVTGTNGKTTVTELIGSMFRAAGKKSFVGGNIGTPIGEYLISDEDFEVAVLEVSSFQLDVCGSFTPDVGIVLNITPDHLDRHGTLEHYGAAKMKMFRSGSGTIGVINGDDVLCERFAGAIEDQRWMRFGHDGNFDAVIDGSRIRLKNGRSYELAGSRLDNLSGRLNSSAALLAVAPFNLDPDCLQRVLQQFEPGEHRLQKIARVDGVTYINDSKATNTGAVINAIRQIGSGIILIAGGRDKGDDYRLLRDSVAAHVKHLVLIGEAAAELGRILGDLAPVDFPATLEAAVALAQAVSEPGDTVLLSPACASFDMFDDYRHRGRCFAEAVLRLGPADHAQQMAETKR